MTLLKEIRLHLLKHMASTNAFLVNHLCRRGSAFTIGTPGPRRGMEDAIEKQIAGKWHLITLQEASEYVEREIFHERIHFAGCAVLFNKDTVYPDISVKSIYLHDTRRGGMGFTRRSVTCLFSSCCSQWSEGLHRIIAAHQQYLCQEKKGIANKIVQTIRALVAAATLSVLSMKYFLTVPCLRRRAPHHCGDPDPYRTIGRTSVVFLSLLALNDFGK